MNSLKTIVMVAATSFTFGCSEGFQTPSLGGAGTGSSTSSSSSSVPSQPQTPAPTPLADTPTAPDDTTLPGRGITNLNVFFMGHSLVGPHIPHLVAQFSQSQGVSAAFKSQLGWGTKLQSHWEYYTSSTPFLGQFTGDPDHRDAHQALQSGQYNAFVLTEMVEIIHAVKYFASHDYSARWAEFAERVSPGTQLYVYETWPNLDIEGELSGDENHPEYTSGRHNDYWLNKVEFDHERYWKQRIFDPMNGASNFNRVLMIPAGQIMKEFVIQLEGTSGGIGGIANRQALFSDMIHLSELGMYLVGLAQVSTILDRSPCDLPRNWQIRDGSSAQTPSAPLALAMKNVVKRVLAEQRNITGVSFSGASCQ